MEEQYYLDRARLRDLMKQHPHWPQCRFAAILGRSRSWVKKWMKRLRQTPPDDAAVLWGQSRARQTSPRRVNQAIVDRVLDIRDHPPDNLQRTPGPRAILYYLHRDEGLQAKATYLPRSPATIWGILDQHDRIYREPKRTHTPLERPDPLLDWQIDFKSISSVPPQPEGKQQHVVEVLNVVDMGTSLLLDALPREDYNAETAIISLTNTFLVEGLPRSITFDRDPRFVASASSRDFPSAFMRYLLCLDIQIHVCPPSRPDLNAFVERYHRNYEEECLQIHRPTTLDQTHDVTKAYQWHYNHERPHQGVACNNQPPYVAFPSLPKLRRLPEMVDPDRWLLAYHQHKFKRRVRSNGSVEVDKKSYYIGRQFKGCYVVLELDAHQRQFIAWHEGRAIKQLPIKGLHDAPLRFEDYLAFICEQAISEWRRWGRDALHTRRWW